LIRFRTTTVFVLIGWLLAGSSAAEGQNAASTAGARPCTTASPESGARKASKKDRDSNHKESESVTQSACIELDSTVLETQEYLQSHVRKKQWKISDEVTSENSWTFSRELNKEELLGFTKTDPKNADVSWSGGKALVQVNSVELTDGYTRTLIRASFRGFGERADLFAMPKPWWSLESNQSLEDSLISALKRHFHPSQ
jgi:hypothetical protein